MTPTTKPDARLKLLYEMAADRYLRSLPPEHFMEARAQATQRAITVESLDAIREFRPDVLCFNEMLVQYPLDRPDHFGQVVPDNMVVISSAPLDVDGSFNIPLQPVGPTLVLEYVSKSSRRKDYDENMRKYEQLRVPYYLLFYPDNEELSVFRLVDGQFASVTPNTVTRLEIPDLELEVGLLDGWVRYWFRGGLVPLPGELIRQTRAMRDQLNATRNELADTREQLAASQAARLAADERVAAVEAELARLREEMARTRG